MKSRLMMAGGLLAACAMLSGCAQDGRIVAVDQATSSAVMFSGEPGASCDILWRWDPAEDPALGEKGAWNFRNIDECKVVDGGRTLLVNASAGGVATVDIATRRATRYAAIPNNLAGPHSSALLPDGRVAVANSTGVDAVQIVDWNAAPLDPARQRIVRALDLAGAHGVVWDKTRKTLFALGYTNLVEAAYLPETLSLKVVRRWDYRTAAGDAFGHDLLSDGSGGYYFTNHTGVWRIDPETGAITSVLAHGNAKSFSRDAEKGDVLAIPAERWWADHVTVIAPDGAARTVGPFPGARFYKARWVER